MAQNAELISQVQEALAAAEEALSQRAAAEAALATAEDVTLQRMAAALAAAASAQQRAAEAVHEQLASLQAELLAAQQQQVMAAAAQGPPATPPWQRGSPAEELTLRADGKAARPLSISVSDLKKCRTAPHWAVILYGKMERGLPALTPASSSPRPGTAPVAGAVWPAEAHSRGPGCHDGGWAAGRRRLRG